jgi:uncharacterized protein
MRIAASDERALAVAVAIHKGDTESLERLLRDHPELPTTWIVDSRGVARTPLHMAADWPGHFPNAVRAVAILAAAGADLNATVAGPRGSAETALHGAASSDDVAVIDALLDSGADIEAPGAIFTGGTAMSDAVVFAQWRAARRLLERGAKTTFWQAAALGLLDRVRDFFSAEPAPTAEEITNALWNACRGGQRPTAELLLERGADLNWVGHDGKTPYDAAQESGDDAFLHWLRERGAEGAAELKHA